jgi:predicted RNA-binding Zn ribbon-like protein
MTASKAVRESDWKDGFLFVGNHLALDFLNTRPMQDGEPIELLPDINALLRWFVAAGLLSSQQAANLQRQWKGAAESANVTKAIRELREHFRDEVLAREKGSAVHRSMIDELNTMMKLYPMRTRLTSSKGGLVMDSWFEVRNPEDLISPLAYSAANLLATGQRTRLRKCGNPDCVLHFLDTSKKGTRRWCSMQLCGNRHKVAAYAARKRASKLH